MNRKVRSTILSLAAICAMVSAGYGQERIAVTASADKKEIVKVERSLKKIFPSWKTSVVKTENGYLLETAPFEDPKALTVAYLKLREKFPQAFIVMQAKEKTAEEGQVKTIKTPVYIEKTVYIEKEDQTLWIALFGLGIIGIFALFLSSDQIRQMRKKYIQMQKRQDEIEEKQSYLVEKMGEQIQEVTIKSIQEEEKLLDINLHTVDPNEIKTHIENLKEHDEDLLQTTYEMIDFLKIKSGNIVIKEEPFQLSNMLHMLTNTVSSLLRIETRRLQYDIAPNVPRYIVGDGVRIHQVLCNLVAHTLESALDAKVKLNIEIVEGRTLVFDINNPTQLMDKEEIDRLFIPSSWEELQDSGTKYSFFVTNELVSRMGGSLVISSREKEGTRYQLRLPYIEDSKKQSKREALQKALKGKKILLIDHSVEEAKVLKNILEMLEAEVEFVASELFHQMKPDLHETEIVFLRPNDINPLNLHFFKTLHENKRIKIILVHNIFVEADLHFIVSEVADAELYKPVITGDVEEVLTQLYLKKKEKTPELIHDEEKLKRFRIESKEDISRNVFREFSGKRIMVVEDNEVNQKVLTSILESADIKVYKAENGRQALNMLNRGTIVDLILMDMSMPVMDGFEATKKIKDEPLFRKIPVLAVTGLGFHHELERMQFVGVDACIIKPFKLGDLYEGLKRYLEVQTPLRVSSDTTMHYYEPPKQILDVKRGVRNVHNGTFYREILQDVKETLEHSDKYFADLIYKGKIDELQAFCRDSLSLVDTVGAYQVAKIFKEILVFISIGERKSLIEYVPIYERAWRLLEKEIALYLG